MGTDLRRLGEKSDEEVIGATRVDEAGDMDVVMKMTCENG